jgi:hypothetical protein
MRRRRCLSYSSETGLVLSNPTRCIAYVCILFELILLVGRGRVLPLFQNVYTEELEARKMIHRRSHWPLSTTNKLQVMER